MAEGAPADEETVVAERLRRRQARHQVERLTDGSDAVVAKRMVKGFYVA